MPSSVNDVSRRTVIDGMQNLRDLGGYRTSDGRATQWGRLYRSDAPCSTSPHALHALSLLGLRSVVDLRDNDECAAAPTVLPASVERIAVPISRKEAGGEYFDAVMNGTLSDFNVEQLAALQQQIFEQQAPHFGRLLRFMADPNRLPMLVHCVSGKDRTGLAVALVLEAVGVERDAVLADYAATTRYRIERMADLGPILAAVGVELTRVEALFGAPPDALAASLDYLEHRYGSVDGYLMTSAGLSLDVLAGLRECLLQKQHAHRTTMPAAGP